MQKTNFFYLLVALLFLLLSIPITDDLRGISTPVAKAVVFSVMLLIGIWSLRGSGRFFSIGIVFVVAGFVLNIVAINSHTYFLSIQRYPRGDGLPARHNCVHPATGRCWH